MITPDRPAPPRRPAELDDLTLARAQRGDRDARRKLVQRYQRPVFALLSRMLYSRDRSLVEDIAQETFLRVFRALKTYRIGGPARLSTWILTIASNRAIDELRRKRADVPQAEVDFERMTHARSATDETTERRMLATLIRRAVDDLAPEYRAAFLLREYHHMTYAEVADALSIDLGTVKSRLGRARKALRRKLAEVYDAT